MRHNDMYQVMTSLNEQQQYVHIIYQRLLAMNNQDIPSTTSEDLKKKLEIKSKDLIAYPPQNLASIV